MPQDSIDWLVCKSLLPDSCVYLGMENAKIQQIPPKYNAQTKSINKLVYLSLTIDFPVIGMKINVNN